MKNVLHSSLLAIILVHLGLFEIAHAENTSPENKVFIINPSQATCKDLLLGMTASIEKTNGGIYLEEDFYKGQVLFSYISGAIDAIAILTGNTNGLNHDALTQMFIDHCNKKDSLKNNILDVLSNEFDINSSSGDSEKNGFSIASGSTCPQAGDAIITGLKVIMAWGAESTGDYERYADIIESLSNQNFEDFILKVNLNAYLTGFVVVVGFSEPGAALSYIMSYCSDKQNSQRPILPVLKYLVDNRDLY